MGLNKTLLASIIAGMGSFDPASLYKSGEKGFAYDFTNKSKLFQLSGGTTAVTAENDPIGYVTDLSGNGKHGTQATTGSRPIYAAASGAVVDGTKFMSCGTIDLSAASALTVIACVQTSVATSQSIYEHGSFNAGDASLNLNSAVGGYMTGTLYGATLNPACSNVRGKPSAAFMVVSAVFDRSKATALTEVNMRINGELNGNTQVTAGASGAALFASRSSQILNAYDGLKLNGKMARILVIGRLLTASELFAAEYWAGQGGGLSLISELPPAGSAYYELLNSYGQSLSVGVTASPSVVSSTTRFNDVMFTSGVHINPNGQNYSSLVPLVESLANESASPEGETIVSGMAEMSHELGYTNPFVGVATGFPSLTIAQLSQGQIAYNNFLVSVTNAMRRSREQFKHFKVRAFPWMQGESDGANASYAANMATLQGTMTTDVQAITGQTEPVWMLSYQLARPKIGIAQLYASENSANIRVAMPMYHLPNSDGVHLTSLSYKIAGAYFGRAYKAIIIDGNTSWKPLSCQSSSVAGSVLDLVFNPVGALALDTTIVASQTNSGFKLYQSDGTTPITISSVTLQGSDIVRIMASSSIPAGAILRYGFSDPSDHTANVSKGNLRDTQGDTIVFDGGGINYPLHNWCVLFQRTVS